VVARTLRLPVLEAEAVLERLTAWGLIRRARSDLPAYVTGQGVQPSGVRETRYVPEPPTATLGALLQTRANELVNAGATVERLAELYTRSRQATLGRSRAAEVVEGPDDVGQAVHDVLATTGVELLTLDRQPFVRTETYGLQPTMLDLLARGVEVRTIYAGDAYRVSGYASYMRQAALAGEQSRLLAHLPLRFLVSDRGTAMLPLTADGPWVSAALVVRGHALVSDLVHTFEDLWERAVVTDEAGETVPREPEFSEHEVALLRMLANDLTESAIGRHLGASARTVGRHIAQLQRKLGTATRFGLGAEAARRGLI
jgi:DNA-binding CsgD family transcriptional regulator